MLPHLSGIDCSVPDGIGDEHSTFAIPRWITHPFGALGSKILHWDHRELHQDGNSQNPCKIQDVLDMNSHCGFQESAQGIPGSLWHLVGKEPGPTFPQNPNSQSQRGPNRSNFCPRPLRSFGIIKPLENWSGSWWFDGGYKQG